MLRISGGYLKGRYIVVKNNSLKPTSEVVRQALFNSIDVASSSFLDMFCGSGIVGIEAISRGASYVCFVEKSNSLTRQLTKNLLSLGINNSSYSLITNTWSSAIKLLEMKNIKFDYIFADPFYDFKEYTDLILKLRALCHKNTIIIIEYSSRNKIEIPEDVRVIQSRTYGETKLDFLTFSNSY